jgi:hypothetical protein
MSHVPSRWHRAVRPDPPGLPERQTVLRRAAEHSESCACHFAVRCGLPNCLYDPQLIHLFSDFGPIHLSRRCRPRPIKEERRP